MARIRLLQCAFGVILYPAPRELALRYGGGPLRGMRGDIGREEIRGKNMLA